MMREPSQRSWRYTCSPQRKLWVCSAKAPKARAAGGIHCFLQIGNNQSGAILGAGDDVRKKMIEGPTHAYLCRPGWGLGTLLISYPQLALWATDMIASFAGFGEPLLIPWHGKTFDFDFQLPIYPILKSPNYQILKITQLPNSPITKLAMASIERNYGFLSR